MLDADNKKNATHDNDDWHAWQRAATDYWVLLHPQLARLRRGDDSRTPSTAEMQERAESVRGAMHGVPTTWRLAPPSPERTEHLARVGWFHEQLAGLYGPIDDAIERLRRDDASSVETLIKFLEADVFCFRSGYKKAEVITVVTRAPLDDEALDRLRRVVVAAVDGVDRREFRSYIRLARRVDSPALRAELTSRLSSALSRTVRHAEWMLAGLGEHGATPSANG